MKARLAGPRQWLQHLQRIAMLLLLCTVALQIFFVARIALMAVLDPQSTTFQRSEAWRLMVEKQQIAWAQAWVNNDRIAVNLKRAVIASEDAGFVDHGGVDWDAVDKAWGRNQKAAERIERRAAKQSAAQKPVQDPPSPRSLAALPSRSSWRRTCFCQASEPCCARPRNCC